MSDPGVSQVQPRKSHRRWRYVAMSLVLVGAIGLGWTLVVRAAAIRMYIVPSVSMSPMIQPGDRVAVELSRTTLPERGEIWVFATPAMGLGVPGQAIKRVVGLPGETIAVEGGKVLIDGRPIVEDHVVTPITYAMAARKLGPTDYFLLGDNRNASNDSHVWGPVPLDRLMGRALYRIWPWNRAGGL